MSVKLNSVGGGSVTLLEPNTASDFTISIPARAGTTVLQDGSNNLLMNSGYGSDAVAYGCRAWVNFNGTGTVAIRASGNVSSITDNGTGNYTVNFTTAMPDLNYSSLVTGSGQEGVNIVGSTNLRDPSTFKNASGFRIQCYGATGADLDMANVNAAAFR